MNAISFENWQNVRTCRKIISCIASSVFLPLSWPTSNVSPKKWHLSPSSMLFYSQKPPPIFVNFRLNRRSRSVLVARSTRRQETEARHLAPCPVDRCRSPRPTALVDTWTVQIIPLGPHLALQLTTSTLSLSLSSCSIYFTPSSFSL